jgi:gas vesicle protein
MATEYAPSGDDQQNGALTEVGDEQNEGDDSDRVGMMEAGEQNLDVAAQAAREAYERAKGWVGQRLEGTKQAVGKAGRFLGRLGMKTLVAAFGLPTGIKNAASDAREAAVDTYQHVSSEVKTRATAAGERIQTGYENVKQRGREVAEWGRDQADAVRSRYGEVRQGVIDRVHDTGIGADLRVLGKETEGSSAEVADLSLEKEGLMERVAQINEQIARAERHAKAARKLAERKRGELRIA